MLGELQVNGKKIVFDVDSATILTVIALGCRHTQTLGVATHLTIWPSRGCGPIWLALGAGVGDTPELRQQLQEELVDRLAEHPMRDWSCPLIRAVLVSLDMFPKVGLGPVEPGHRGLRLVR